jgi:hypothetical protein
MRRACSSLAAQSGLPRRPGEHESASAQTRRHAWAAAWQRRWGAARPVQERHSPRAARSKRTAVSRLVSARPEHTPSGAGRVVLASCRIRSQPIARREPLRRRGAQTLVWQRQARADAPERIAHGRPGSVCELPLEGQASLFAQPPPDGRAARVPTDRRRCLAEGRARGQIVDDQVERERPSVPSIAQRALANEHVWIGVFEDPNLGEQACRAQAAELFESRLPGLTAQGPSRSWIPESCAASSQVSHDAGIVVGLETSNDFEWKQVLGLDPGVNRPDHELETSVVRASAGQRAVGASP